MSCQTSYPEVYRSVDVERIHNSTPTLPEPPKEPEKPIIVPAPDNSNKGCMAVFIIGGIVGIIALLSSDVKLNGEMIYYVVLACILLIFAIPIAFAENKSKQEQEQEHQKSKATFESRKAQYDKDFANYQKELSEYKDRIAYMKSDEYLADFRKKSIEEWLKSRSKPSVIDYVDNDVVKKGVSEPFFYDYMLSYYRSLTPTFDSLFKVYVNKKIPAGDSFYYPDILFVYKDCFFVDIEIDEPYSGNDGSPIHYIDNDSRWPESIDYNRNSFVRNEGFEIVRFSEEQIFLHPDECCRYIIDFCAKSLYKHSDYQSSNEFMVKKWTKDEASKMAYQHFRKTYVPAEYQPMIDKEVQRSYADFDRNLGDV